MIAKYPDLGNLDRSSNVYEKMQGVGTVGGIIGRPDPNYTKNGPDLP
jgi:hypothetical protein